jgi:two-component system, chemotaxis family, sensor kinase CheA
MTKIENIGERIKSLKKHSKSLLEEFGRGSAELIETCQIFDSILQSLGCSFLVIDREGACVLRSTGLDQEYPDLFHPGDRIWDILKEPQESFEPWWQTLFDGPIPFEDLISLAPPNLRSPDGQLLVLDYHPLRNGNNSFRQIIILITNQTKESEQQQKIQKEKDYSDMLVRLIKNKPQLLSFIRNARAIIQVSRDQIETGSPETALLLRVMHTFKGGCASFSMRNLTTIAHKAESLIAKLESSSDRERAAVLKKLSKAIGSLEVNLDTFLRENKEIVGPDIQRGERSVEVPLDKLTEFSRKLASRPETSCMAKDFNLQFMTEPAQKFFSHYDDMVGMLAAELGKELAPIVYEGGDLKIIGKYYSELFTSMVHAFRNAVDHGIEPPAIRIREGKDREGRITVRFSKASLSGSAWFRVDIEDDGYGVDPSILSGKALSQKTELPPLSKDSSSEIQPIFNKGVTGEKKITQMSGRGIGLNVILAAVQELDGAAEIFSTAGQGTCLSVIVPYFEDIDALSD